MVDHGPNIRVLQASVDEEMESEFRILVDNKFVKYITIEGGVYEVDDMCFGPTLVTLLPPFPPGDWNLGFVARDPDTRKPCFSMVFTKELPGIISTWHPTRIDHLALCEDDKLRTGVYTVTCPSFFESRIIVAKFARFDWEIAQLEAETEAYQWIQGQGIGPTFLGHLTEQGRVIGFLIKHIPNGRRAEPEDHCLCYEVLTRLHALGIKHGDINRHNFLIHNGRGTVIDFDTASRPADLAELTAEMGELQNQLQDTSGKGGRILVSGGGSDEGSS